MNEQENEVWELLLRVLVFQASSVKVIKAPVNTWSVLELLQNHHLCLD